MLWWGFESGEALAFVLVLVLIEAVVQLADQAVEQVAQSGGVTVSAGSALVVEVKRTTIADPQAVRPRDLVGGRFAPLAPDRLWVADIERHEALLNRVEVKDLHGRAVAAAW